MFLCLFIYTFLNTVHFFLERGKFQIFNYIPLEYYGSRIGSFFDYLYFISASILAKHKRSKCLLIFTFATFYFFKYVKCRPWQVIYAKNDFFMLKILQSLIKAN